MDWISRPVYLALSMIGLVSTMLFLTAFITPTSGSLIITFGDSQETQLATQELQIHYPDAKVVRYKSFEYLLLVSRISGPIHLVGQGYEEEIALNNNMDAIVPWYIIQIGEQAMQGNLDKQFLSTISQGIFKAWWSAFQIWERIQLIPRNYCRRWTVRWTTPQCSWKWYLSYWKLFDEKLV